MDGRRYPIIKNNPNSTQSDPKRIPKSTKALSLCLSLSLSLSLSVMKPILFRLQAGG